MSQTKPVLEIQHLNVEMDNTILKNINLKLMPGEHLAILGPNGSGKTTLLNAITGYCHFSSGRLSFLGQPYGKSDWTELRKSIGIVSAGLQSRLNNAQPALSTVLSGKSAMLGYCPSASAKEKNRALRLMEELGCAHLRNKPWQKLSQGERQRVLIARALMAKARLLILDEPCAGLDPVSRERLLSGIEALIQTKSQLSIIFVTHHIEEIMPGFSHVMLLKKGKILLCGPKKKILKVSHLKQLFEVPLNLSTRKQRYWMQLHENF